MNFSYLKLSKEEYKRALIVYDSINNDNVKNFLKHLLKSMEFLSDGLIGFRVDMFNIGKIKNFVTPAAGEDFLDFYFYLYNLNKKNFNFIGSNNIIVQGRKNVFKLSVNDFHNYLLKVRDYFNKTYNYLEK